MEETPKPVPLNALRDILAKAKKVMVKSDAASPIVLSEATQKQVDSEAVEERMVETIAPSSNQMYTKEQVMASKLPDVVKQAMINKPIPRLQGPPAKFTLEDMTDLDDVVMTPNKKRTISESKTAPLVSNKSDMISISKADLKEMIDDRVELLIKVYTKNLRKDTIAETINALIKEGKLKMSKKTL